MSRNPGPRSGAHFFGVFVVHAHGEHRLGESRLDFVVEEVGSGRKERLPDLEALQDYVQRWAAAQIPTRA